MNEDMSHDHDHDAQHDGEDYDQKPKANQLSRRDFGGVSLAHENAATQALIAKSTAEIQARWIMAMRRPRDMNDVRQNVLKECRRPGFAKVAIYEVPRGQTKIRGLSIRFAEVVMRCMTNMSCEAQTIYDSDEERIVRITVTDFETNVTWPKDITVKKTVERKFLKRGQRPIRERENSYGDKVFIVEATDDDVVTKEAAMVSKAARTLILRVIPGHLQDEALQLCMQLRLAEDKANPDAAKNQIFDAYAALGIMPSELESYLGKAAERITPDDIGELRSLYTAIRDGEITWEAAIETGRKGATVTDQAAPAAAAKPADPKTAPAAAPKSGKGTAAVKDQLKKPDPKAPPPAAEKPADPAPAEKPKMMSERDGYEERKCASCNVPIECKVDDPPGARCYACSQA